MVRVLQAAHNDPSLMAGNLMDYEVDTLMSAYEARRRAAQLRELRRDPPMSASSKILNVGDVTNTPVAVSSVISDDDDAQCPICLMGMVDGESLVTCDGGCHNRLHHYCMAVWAADRHTQAQPLLCPLCRTPWIANCQSAISTKVYTNGDSVECRRQTDKLSGISSIPSHTAQSIHVSVHDTLTYSTSSCIASITDSAYSSPDSVKRFNSVFTSVTPPTIKAEVSAALAAAIAEEDVPLPRSEAIPAEHERAASVWVQVFGVDLVACLFSRDWVVREAGLKKLAYRVVKVLHWDKLTTTEEKQSLVIHCCVNILAQVANDPVYKVYLACLRCLRVLLFHLRAEQETQVQRWQELLRPLINTLLLKCVDGNRRTSQISMDSVVELCRGQEGELALGLGQARAGLGGLEYILSCIVEGNAPAQTRWQWLLCRLSVLDRLLDIFPDEFQLRYVAVSANKSDGVKLTNYDRLLSIVEFAFKSLSSNHKTVSKLSRRVYICGARLAAAEPAAFHQVCDMLARLDISMQTRLKKRLKMINGSFAIEKENSNILPSKYVASTLVNSQNILLQNRHCRKRIAQNSLTQKLSTIKLSQTERPELPSLKFEKKEVATPKRPTYLPLDSFQTKFKEKQARLRQYHQMRQQQEVVPLPAHNILKSAMQRRSHIEPKPIFPSTNLRKRSLPSRTEISELKSPPKCPISTFESHLIPNSEPQFAPLPPPTYFQDPALVNFCKMDPRSFEPPVLFSEKQCHSPALSSWEEVLPIVPGPNLMPVPLTSLCQPHKNDLEVGTYEEGQDYRLGPLLGTGAFCSCYQAVDKRTGTLMAVKLISFCRNSVDEQERLEEAVEGEIVMLSQLRHPHLLRLLGAVRGPTCFSVFTEWMAGGSVAGLLERYGAFSEPVVLRYVEQMLKGLAYLHDNSILHRDLKGANLLLDSTGQWLRIGDFGTAVRMASNGGTVSGEFQGQLLGTIAFMAPEVLRGENYGRSCDVWSVGCCVLEMATAKPPWGADQMSNQLKLMYRIAISTLPPSLPESLSRITQDFASSCLQIAHHNRPFVTQLLQHPCFRNNLS